MEMKSIQYLKAAAGKLRDGKLKRLGGKEVSEALNGMVKSLELDTKDEAIVFAALFDRSCGGRCSDLDDLASYYGASQLDVMEYVPALRSLEKKGFIVQTDRSEFRIGRQNFMVTNYVIGCILENKKPNRHNATILDKEFDKYDLCKLVSSQVQDSDVTTEALFQFVESAERDNASLKIVRDLKEALPLLPDRALFYEICHDFIGSDGNGYSNVNSTLRDIYPAYGIRFRVRMSLNNGTNALIAAGLIELSSNKEDITLTIKGRKLFLGEDFGAFGQQYSGLNLYSFSRKVKEYVHSQEHDAEKEGAIIILEEMERLDGILIATTNLADNLDKAFERRFLFKIRFDKPSVEAKVKIWRYKLPALSDAEAQTLASRFDFSGGEIDNIVRKTLMGEVLEGKATSFTEIEQLCSEEKIGKSSGANIGFK